MSMEPKWSHWGLFAGICPVKMADLDTDCPYVEELWWWLLPLFLLTEVLFGVFCFLISMMNSEVELMFPLWVCGELKRD